MGRASRRGGLPMPFSSRAQAYAMSLLKAKAEGSGRYWPYKALDFRTYVRYNKKDITAQIAAENKGCNKA